MDQVTLGRTGVRVSIVGLGTGGHSQLGRKHGGTDQHAVAIVQAALDRGITLIDTASSYGTEPIVRAALAGRGDDIVVSTKVKITLSDKAGAAGPLIDADEFKRRVETSLSRLGRERIDILHLHGVRADEYAHCRSVLVPALHDLRAAGKVRFFGLTEKFDEDTTHAMLEGGGADDDTWDVVMTGVNMVNHTAQNRVLPTLRRRGVGVMCMYAVRSGLVDRPAAAALVSRLLAKGEADAGDVDPADPLGFVVSQGGARTLTEAAYRFSRHAAGVNVVLTGTGSIAHLDENIRAIHGPALPPAVLDRLARIFARVRTESGDIKDIRA